MKLVPLTENYMKRKLDEQGLIPFVTDKSLVDSTVTHRSLKAHTERPPMPRNYVHEAGLAVGIYRDCGDRVYPRIPQF